MTKNGIPENNFLVSIPYIGMLFQNHSKLLTQGNKLSLGIIVLTNFLQFYITLWIILE